MVNIVRFENDVSFLIVIHFMELELIYYFTYFSTVVPSNSCVFLSCRPFFVNTFSLGLVGVENILTTKGLQKRNAQLYDGGKIGKIIN